MQNNNPMNLTNLLNGPTSEQENNNTLPSRRSSHDASHFNSPLAYRQSNNHGPCAPPSPPASDYSPGQQFQQLVLPRPSKSNIAPVEEMARCELVVRPPGYLSLPSPHDPYASFQRQLPPIQNFDFEVPDHHVIEQPQYHSEYDYRYQRSLASPVFSHSSRSRAGSFASTTLQSPSMVSRSSRHGISKQLPKPKTKKSSPSNVKYTTEQVDFCRYMKEDGQKRWDDVVVLFKQYFPHEKRDSNQCLTSRFYRDNDLPLVDENWNLIFEGNDRSSHSGNRKVQRQPAKVRDRTASHYKDAPHKLVEKHPQRALTYSWVSTEHKERARRILEDDRHDQMMGCISNAAHWRRVIAQADEISNKENR